MKICIVGAGAIGGWIGTKLAAAGLHEVSALARGETLAALQQHGWRLNTAAGLVQAPLYKASSDAASLGVQDLVVIAVKSQSLPSLAPQLAPLIGKHTLILPAMNGVPWWFYPSLQSVDPSGQIARALPADQVLGCVVHASTSTSEPGLVQHKMGDKLIVGEPDSNKFLDGQSERSKAVCELLLSAGFEVTHSANIRQAIWYKLWGNMTMNPISAITGATVDKVLADPLTRAFISSVMIEAKAIGARIGCPIDESPEDRHAVTARLGSFKTSMLQDVEAGRSIELDALVAAVKEIGEKVGIATPNIDALLGLTRVFAQVKKLY